MNSRQLRVLWCGVIAAVLLLLFPPLRDDPHWNWPTMIFYGVNYEVRDLLLPLGAVALLTIAGIYTLRNVTKDL